MRRALAIALALVGASVAAADHRTPPKGIALPMGCRDRSCVRSRVAASPPVVYSLALSWAWPNTSAGSQLPSLSDANLVRLCRVGAAGSSTTTWDCEKADGTSGITWTGNTGLTTAKSFIEGQYAAYFGTTDGAKSTSIADIDTALNGAYTVLVGWYANANAVGWAFQDIGTGVVQMSEQGAELLEYDDGAASFGPNTPQCIGGWCFVALRSNGAGSLSITVDGAKTTGSGAHTTITSGVHTFGNRSAKDIGLNGYLLFVAYFNTNMSDALVAKYRANYYAAYNAAGDTGGSAGGGIYNTSTGNVDFFTGAIGASSHQLGGSPGLFCSKGGAGGKNFYAADALDAASWTDVGAPTTNVNVSSGPFAAYKNQGAECDEIVDTSGGTAEGKTSLTGGTSLGFYTCGSFMKAGLTGTTKTKARIVWDTDGTSSVAGCNVTGLTSTAVWQECKTQITGTPTYVKCQLLDGNVAADTGSFQVCGGFANYSPNAEMFRLTNAAVGASNYSLDTTTWPDITSKGKVVWVHTPLFDPLTQWATGQGTYYMFDAATGGAHTITEIFGYTSAGTFYAQAGGSSYLTSNVGLTPLQAYSTSAEWYSVGGGNCLTTIRHDSCGATPAATCPDPTTVIASGVNACATQPDEAMLCDRNDHSVPSSLLFNAIRLYQ